jgi:hypothetical protein
MFVVDPFGRYRKSYTADQIIEVCGLIPGWVQEWAENDTDDRQSLKDWLVRRYGFPVFEMGGKVDQSGIYSFPGDPDLYPYVTFIADDGTRFFQYPYAIICVRTLTGDYVTRMD